jgi:hypothetical protein
MAAHPTSLQKKRIELAPRKSKRPVLKRDRYTPATYHLTVPGDGILYSVNAVQFVRYVAVDYSVNRIALYVVWSSTLICRHNGALQCVAARKRPE